MNSSALRGLTSLILLLLAFSSIAQQETNSTEHTEDSLAVVVPEQKNADLKMITPPEGFEETDKFNGYIHYQAGTAIIMTMIENANYLNFDKGMTDEYFAQKQMTVVKREEFKSNNNVGGIMYKCSFRLQEMDFIRYFVYAGDLNQTLWLNITYPVQYEGLVEGEIRKAIMSITLNPDRNEK